MKIPLLLIVVLLLAGSCTFLSDEQEPGTATVINESVLLCTQCHLGELNSRHADFQSAALPTELRWRVTNALR